MRVPDQRNEVVPDHDPPDVGGAIRSRRRASARRPRSPRPAAAARRGRAGGARGSARGGTRGDRAPVRPRTPGRSARAEARPFDVRSPATRSSMASITSNSSSTSGSRFSVSDPSVAAMMAPDSPAPPRSRDVAEWWPRRTSSLNVFSQPRLRSSVLKAYGSRSARSSGANPSSSPLAIGCRAELMPTGRSRAGC